MLLPRYYYTDDYTDFLPILLQYPHTKREVRKGESILQFGSPLEQIYYYQSGTVKATLTHEDGYEKILSFHGPGSIFPGCHDLDFQIELSIEIRAVSNTTAFSFSREVFRRILAENPAIHWRMYNWYATYINLLLYETAHQEYNSAFLKLCNLLYLFVYRKTSKEALTIPLTQQELSSILAVERANIARYLSRLREEGIIETRRGKLLVTDLKGLEGYCSLETLPQRAPGEDI